MSFLKSIFKGLQNEPQHDYATATNSHRIHQFFVTETRNRKPNDRGICNRNRNFKTRARILNTVSSTIIIHTAMSSQIMYTCVDMFITACLPNINFHIS